MFGHGCGASGGWRGAGRRGEGGWGGMDFGPLGAAFWGGFGGGRGRPFRGGRMFVQGDLKYVILRLLDEKPRHGYDIIKELEERSGGAYSPSPGTVYPTLTMLEDLGYARAREEDGKKVYEITDAGRAHLAENRGTVDDIFERIAQFTAGLFGEPMREVHQSMRDLGLAFKDVLRETYANAHRSSDPERIRRVREVLERAAREIEEIWREAPRTATQDAPATDV